MYIFVSVLNKCIGEKLNKKCQGERTKFDSAEYIQIKK